MNSKRHGASFTLVEMMVGIAVFSLLMLLLLTIMGGAAKLWQQQSAKEESFREVRAALTTLSWDMRSALISTNPYWFYSNMNQVAFVTALPGSSQGAGLGVGTPSLGNICVVGYSLEWGTNETSGTQTNMSLYRYVTFSSSTYTNYLYTNNNTYSVSNVFNTNSASPTYVDGTNTVRELVARNVSQFTFTAYTNDPSGTPWPSQNQAFLSNMTLSVAITALNNRVAAQLTSQAQWLNANSPLIQQNEESFAFRVRPPTP